MDKKVIPILMPQAGQSMEEGTILSWKAKIGDKIAVGQIIFEIETDKATMEVEAVDAGRLSKIVVSEGQIVPVKTPVAYLADSDSDVEAFLAGQTAPNSVPDKKLEKPIIQTVTIEQTKVEASRQKVSPAARKLAEQKGIDTSSISAGSGIGGRIITNDLQSSSDKSTPSQPVAAPKMSKMRKVIAERLTFSKQNIPHFYIKLTIDARELFSLYKKTKPQLLCSVNDFVIKACAKAIRQHASFRSQYKNEQIVEFPNVNIGVAVGLDDGLVVPVVLDADKMDLKALAARVKVIIENARNGKIEGMGQGVFTITNLGMFGTEEFSAIINPPESAILAVGAIRENIKVENGAMQPTRLMTLTLSVDHRVIDGVAAAKFLQTIKELLEKPEVLLN
ncbi:MAG: dihydrolipoamide acetyltransferase family protein [Phycisphaerae bacterium]|jgi:pyruvate dehydrogenase E2 component (dihydrolipoamide acetyltransferase)